MGAGLGLLERVVEQPPPSTWLSTVAPPLLAVVCSIAEHVPTTALTELHMKPAAHAFPETPRHPSTQA